MAEWFKALASGASPQGRGLEPHSCHSLGMAMRRRCAWSTVAALDMEDRDKPEIVNKYLARSLFSHGQTGLELHFGWATSITHPSLTSTLRIGLLSRGHELQIRTVWPSGLRRWLQAPVRKGVGSNPTAVILWAWPCAGDAHGALSPPWTWKTEINPKS